MDDLNFRLFEHVNLLSEFEEGVRKGGMSRRQKTKVKWTKEGVGDYNIPPFFTELQVGGEKMSKVRLRVRIRR